MSLLIEVNKISRVKIGDEWFTVMSQSFDIDSYEFSMGGSLVHGGGQSGVCASGFQFVTEGGRMICGELTSISCIELHSEYKE